MAQTHGSIRKVDPPILDSTALPWRRLQNTKMDLLLFVDLYLYLYLYGSYILIIRALWGGSAFWVCPSGLWNSYSRGQKVGIRLSPNPKARRRNTSSNRARPIFQLVGVYGILVVMPAACSRHGDKLQRAESLPATPPSSAPAPARSVLEWQQVLVGGIADLGALILSSPQIPKPKPGPLP